MELRTGALARADNKCENCFHVGNQKNPLQVDHIKPLGRYPEIPWDTMWNVQILCRKCNLKKGTAETDYRKNPISPAIVRDILMVASKGFLGEIEVAEQVMKDLG